VDWEDLNGALERIKEASRSETTARWRQSLFGLFISFLEATLAVERNSPAFLTRNDAAERSSG
jgi:hypothetical protein